MTSRILGFSSADPAPPQPRPLWARVPQHTLRDGCVCWFLRPSSDFAQPLKALSKGWASGGIRRREAGRSPRASWSKKNFDLFQVLYRRADLFLFPLLLSISLRLPLEVQPSSPRKDEVRNQNWNRGELELELEGGVGDTWQRLSFHRWGTWALQRGRGGSRVLGPRSQPEGVRVRHRKGPTPEPRNQQEVLKLSPNEREVSLGWVIEKSSCAQAITMCRTLTVASSVDLQHLKKKESFFPPPSLFFAL